MLVTRAGQKTTHTTDYSGTLPSRFCSSYIECALRWVRKGTFAILEQGVFSASGFLLNVLLARWLRPEEYGFFSLGYATMLFLLGVENALVLEPMSVLGPSRYREQLGGYLRHQVRLHVLITGGIGLCLAAMALLIYGLGRDSVASLVMTVAFALPLYGQSWLARRFFYVLGQTQKALEVSSLNFGLSLVLVVALRHFGALGPLPGIGILAGAGVVSGLWGVFRLRGLSRLDGYGGISLVGVFREHWRLGRWLFYATPLGLASQALVWVPAAFLGLAEVAATRALSNLVLPLQQTATALYTLSLSTLAASFRREPLDRFRKKGFWVVSGMTGLALGYTGLLTIVARLVEGLLYAGKYAPYAWLGPLLALDAALAVWGMGQVVLLKAMERMDLAVLSGSSTGIGLLALSAGLTYHFGLEGLVAGMITSRVLALWLNAYLLRKALTGTEGERP